MKYFIYLFIIVFISFTFLSSCRIDPKAKPKTKTINPNLAEPAQNASGVWHYTCLSGCAGGDGVASQCETCGKPLVHNTVYHGTNPTTPIKPNSNSPFATPPASTSGTNINGVWHYTCLNGCVGGDGVASNCNTCGDKLAHNQAYH